MGEPPIEVIVAILILFQRHLEMLQSLIKLSKFIIGLSSVPIVLCQVRLLLVFFYIGSNFNPLLDNLFAIRLELDCNTEIHQGLHEMTLSH